MFGAHDRLLWNKRQHSNFGDTVQPAVRDSELFHPKSPRLLHCKNRTYNSEDLLGCSSEDIILVESRWLCSEQVSARAGRDHSQSPKIFSASSNNGEAESSREGLGPVSAQRGQMTSFSSHKLLPGTSVKHTATKQISGLRSLTHPSSRSGT